MMHTELGLQMEEAIISQSSPIIGKTLVSSNLRQDFGVIIVAIKKIPSRRWSSIRGRGKLSMPVMSSSPSVRKRNCSGCPRPCAREKQTLLPVFPRRQGGSAYRLAGKTLGHQFAALVLGPVRGIKRSDIQEKWSVFRSKGVRERPRLRRF